MAAKPRCAPPRVAALRDRKSLALAAPRPRRSPPPLARREQTRRRQRARQYVELADVQDEGQSVAAADHACNTAQVVTAAESRRGLQIRAAGAEHLRDPIHAQRDAATGNVDEDPFSAAGVGQRRQTEASAQLHDRYDLAAMIGDAGDGVR